MERVLGIRLDDLVTAGSEGAALLRFDEASGDQPRVRSEGRSAVRRYVQYELAKRVRLDP